MMKRKQALHKAILDVDVERVQSLLHHSGNSDPDFLEDLGNMLHMTDNPRIGQLLLIYGANVNAKNARSQTPLFTALRKVHRNPDYISTLLEYKADVNYRDCIGNTPLHLAVGNPRYNLDLIKRIVDNEADVNASNEDRDTPLHVVLRNSNIIPDTNWWIENSQRSEPLRKLTSGRGPEVRPSIQEKVFDNRWDVVKLLLDHGADVNISNNNDGSPLHIALANLDCDSPVVLELLERGAQVTNEDHFLRNTPLHVAVQNCKTELRVVKALLTRGADINVRNQNFNTPLHFAAKTLFLNMEILKILLQHGADGKAKNSRGYTALHLAAHSNPCAIPTLLRNATLDVNDRNSAGDTPLMVLLKKSTLFPCIVKDMIQAGAEVNVSNHSLKTPLYYAIFNLSSCKVGEMCRLQDSAPSVFECVSATMSRLDLEAQTSENCVGMDYPRAEQLCETKLQVVKILLKHNADINAEDLVNDTPWKIAVEKLLDGVDDGCCPKLLIKYGVLKGPDTEYQRYVQLEPYKAFRECGILLRYFRMCVSEVTRMKNTRLIDNLTLHELVSGAKLHPRYDVVIRDPKVMSDLVFERLLKQKYTIYCDVISERIERQFLVHKFTKLKLQSKPGSSGRVKKPVILNSDVLSIISDYLTHIDMLRFVMTFTNVDKEYRPFAEDIRRHMEWLCQGRPQPIPANYETGCSIDAVPDYSTRISQPESFAAPATIKLSAGIICGTARDRFSHVVDRIVKQVKK